MISGRILSVAVIAALAASAANSLTLLQLSGSGDIAIEVTGSITLDTGDVVFDAITLTGDSLVFPAAAPVPDTTLLQAGLDGFTGSFTEDLSLEILSWSGTLSISASDSIFLVGTLLASDPGDPSADPCNVAGAIVLGPGGLPPTGPCAGLEIVAPPGGGIVVDPGVGITPASAIPEPSAAVVFAIGLALLGARLRRLS